MEMMMKYLKSGLEVKKASKGVQPKLEAQPKSSSSPPRNSGAVRTKNDALVTYGLRLGRSTYAWKAKEISFPTQ